MSKCLYCDKEIFPTDADEGTSKELFCGNKCESTHEKAIDEMLEAEEQIEDENETKDYETEKEGEF